MLPELIAPCGMNCGICIAYFGYTMAHKERKHACNGCRSRSLPCAFVQKGCVRLSRREVRYCFECPDFPCEKLTVLDGKYRAKYGMSMIENLREIQANGIDQFLEKEEDRWKCPKCGGIVCVHDQKCYSCERKPVPRGLQHRFLGTY